LIPILDEEMLKKNSAEWIEIFDAEGLPNSPLNTVDQAVNDPNINHRNMVVEVDQPKIGKIKISGSPYHLSETPGTVDTPAPLLGQHTCDYLEKELGYSSEEVKALLEDDVVIQNDYSGNPEEVLV